MATTPVFFVVATADAAVWSLSMVQPELAVCQGKSLILMILSITCACGWSGEKVPPAVLTQAKTPLLVYRFVADLNVRVFERTAILSNFVGPIWILLLAILILNPLPCLSEILERRPPCIGGQVTSIGVIDRAVCVSAPTAEYLNEANRHDHKGNYRKCSHLTLSQRLVQRTPIERLVAALERITGRPFSLGHHALAAEKFIPLAQAFVRFNIYAKRNEIVFSVLVFANEYR